MRFGSALRQLAALALLTCAVRLPAQSFNLDSGRQPLVSLDGLWRFHPGDSPLAPGTQQPLWAASAFDDSAWPLLRSDTTWSAQGYAAMSGFGWYRFTVRVPAGAKPTSVLLAPIVTSFEVYVDGNRVGGSGRMPATIMLNSQILYQLFPLTPAGSSSERILVVALRVWHSPIWANYVGGGPFMRGHLAGDPLLLASEQWHHQLARNVRFVDSYAYSIVAALFGFTILCLFFFRPAEREYLWFAIILLSQSADNVLYVGQQIYSWPPIPINDLLDGLLVATGFYASFSFYWKILRGPVGALSRIVLALVVFSPFPVVFYWPGWFSAPASAAIQLACLLPAAICIFWLLVKRALAGNLDARLLLLPTLLDVGFYVADNIAIVLAQSGWTRLPRVLEVPLPLPPFTMQTGILLHLFFLMAMLIFLILRFTRARRREVWLAGELEAARQVQQVLLPDEQDQCPGFVVESVYQPAEQVGGDFFQQIADGQGGLLIVVGDVSGKGLPAAMMVSVLIGAIRTEAERGTTPAALLRSLNSRMMGRSHEGFTTCLAAHITTDGLLTLANAGHIPPYLNGQEMDLPGALPLGILPHAVFQPATLKLTPGDRLTFVSDGVVEAQAKSPAKSPSKSKSLFGFERTRLLSRQPAAEIAQAARLFGQTDDITVVTVAFTGVPLAAAQR